MLPNINLIWAQTRNGIIGYNGRIPWHLPEDLANFKRLTLGCPIIMGRKTWDSLPPKFRPLPGRRNIVLTKNPGWAAEGAQVAHDLDRALALCVGAPDVWVIGGAEIFKLALPKATRAVATEVDLVVQGDTWAPCLPSEDWQKTAAAVGASQSTGQLFTFLTFERKVETVEANVSSGRPRPQQPPALSDAQAANVWVYTCELLGNHKDLSSYPRHEIVHAVLSAAHELGYATPNPTKEN